MGATNKLSLPNSTKVGDTGEYRINKQPRRVTLRDFNTLVIGPGDARRILHRQVEGNLTTYICTDADGYDDFSIVTSDDKTVIEIKTKGR